MIGVIALVIAIFASLVLFHELGHFVMARRNGVDVEEFGFGFPPRLFGRRFGRTLYSLNLLPFGGFVRLKGENSDTRSPGSFAAAKYVTKAKVLLAGVGANTLMAYLILVWLCLTGLPPLLGNQFTLGQPTYSQPKQVMAAEVEKGSPAEQAGLKQGEVIISGNGQSFATETDLIAFTKQQAGQDVALVLKSAGVERSVEVKLRPADSKDGFLGVTPLATYKLKYGWKAPLVALGLLGQLVWETLAAFGRLFVGLVSHGQVSNQVAGPVGIVALVGNLVHLGLAYLLALVASISVSLAVLNVLPIPALDGGRLTLITVQHLSRHRLSARTEGLINFGGLALLILLSIVVAIVDISRLR